VGCKDKAKESARFAGEHAASLGTLADKDVAEVERGLPEGARQLGRLYAKGADPKQDLPAVRSSLRRVRRDVPDLTQAKSTFFALADASGIGIRNDLEEDSMAGQNLALLFPDLKKALDGAPFAQSLGSFQAKGPPDKDWVAASPIKKEDGAIGGVLVTGWSYRRFALHLQETLKHDLGQKLIESKDTGKLPILYVAVFDRSGAYGAPQTPEVNEKALAAEGLVDKTAKGPVQSVLTITEREFGYAAVRTPKLGPELGIVVLRSEI
jgi:hypothetical protein